MTDDGNRKSASRREPPAAKLFCYLVDMIGPTLQAIANSVDHFALVINSCDARLSATNVIERLFDHVRENAKLAQHR